MACPTCGNHILRDGPATPVAIMCDPNNLLAGGGGGTAGLDYEVAVLANPADLTQPVIVVHNFNPTTGAYTPVYKNVDGTPYVGATPVNVTGSGGSRSNVGTGTIITVTSAVAVGLTVPAGANQADISILDDSATVIVRTDGVAPTNSPIVGHRLRDNFTVESLDELNGFNAIAFPNETVRLYVEFKNDTR